MLTISTIERTKRMNSVADARKIAKKVLPRVVFDYIDGGAEDEVTMSQNELAFREIALRPQMAVKMSEPILATSILGNQISFPVILAPCGLIQIMSPNGALASVRAANRCNTISTLSTVAGITPDQLSDEPGPRWFQLYAPNREIAQVLIEQAKAAGFSGLMVTVDTPALGKRERDLRNGVPSPLRLDTRSAISLGSQVLLRPNWTLRMVRAGIKFKMGTGDKNPISMQASPFTWEDISWIRSQWKESLLVKGILSDTDAKQAVQAGADAIVVSNHGGRQLEGAPASLRVLPQIVRSVEGNVEVLLDSGIRRGADVVKALCLGAKAVLIGRPYLYGLSAGGEQGVERILEVLKSEMTRTMILMGCPSVDQLNESWIQRQI